MQKWKSLNLEPKMPYLGKWGKWGLIWLKAFCAGIWKYYCHTWNERPRISWIIEFGAKMKIVKFGTKDTLFLGCNLKNVLSCLRLTPSNFSKSKIKIFKYRIWLFLAWDFRIYCHISNQHPGICEVRVFNSYSEF